MPRIVLLSEGFAGRTFELKQEKTTVGRHEDNNFQIPAPSVSGHHCEIIMRGDDVVVRDLNSTNGTYVNGDAVTETVLLPGQALRFGHIEARLETSPPPGAPPAASGKKQLDKTTVLPQGVKLNELEQGTQKITFEKNTAFQKKNNVASKVFIGIAVVIAIAIIVVLVMLFK